VKRKVGKLKQEGDPEAHGEENAPGKKRPPTAVDSNRESRHTLEETACACTDEVKEDQRVAAAGVTSGMGRKEQGERERTNMLHLAEKRRTARAGRETRTGPACRT